MRKSFWVGIAACVCLIAALVVSGRAVPLASAQTLVRVWVPADAAVSTMDRIVVTSRSSATATFTTGCPPAGTYPVQSIVVIREGGGATRNTATVFSVELDPGTRLTNLISSGSCTDNGVTYDIFDAVIHQGPPE